MICLNQKFYMSLIGLEPGSKNGKFHNFNCDGHLYYVCEDTSVNPQRCPFADFTRTTYGCFFVDNSDNRRSWNNAEAACQAYGSHVHLVTLDTQEVGTLI